MSGVCILISVSENRRGAEGCSTCSHAGFSYALLTQAVHIIPSFLRCWWGADPLTCWLGSTKMTKTKTKNCFLVLIIMSAIFIGSLHSIMGRFLFCRASPSHFPDCPVLSWVISLKPPTCLDSVEVFSMKCCSHTHPGRKITKASQQLCFYIIKRPDFHIYRYNYCQPGVKEKCNNCIYS